MVQRKLTNHNDRMKWLALKSAGHSNFYIASLSQVSAASVGYTLNRMFDLVWKVEGLPGDYPGLRKIKKFQQIEDLVALCFKNEAALRDLYGKGKKHIDRRILGNSLAARKVDLPPAPAKTRNPFSAIKSWFSRIAA